MKVKRDVNWPLLVAVLIWRLALLALVGFVVWLLFRTAAGLESDVAIAVISAGGVIAASVVGVSIGRYFERKRQIEADARLRKIPLYEEFIDFWFRVLYQKKLGKQVGDKEMIQFFVKFTKGATVWASDEVIRKWVAIRQQFGTFQSPEERAEAANEIMYDLEDLILALRRDTGDPSTTLKRGELLGLFINDLDSSKPSDE